MAPKEATAGLSAREMQQIAIYLKCMKTKPDVDWEKYAELGNYGALDSARASMSRLLRKLMGDDQGSLAGTPRKRKVSEEDAAAEGETPKKKATPKARKGKKGAKAASEVDEVVKEEEE